MNTAILVWDNENAQVSGGKTVVIFPKNIQS